MNERTGFDTLTGHERASVERILRDMLLTYDNERDAKEVKQFCVEYAQQFNAYGDANAALSDVTRICDTIDRIDAEYRSLREAGKQGASRADWLRRVLEEHFRPEQGKTRNQAATEFQRSVTDAATLLLRKVLKRDIPFALPQREAYRLDNPVDAQIAANDLADNMPQIAGLSSILVADQFAQNGERRIPGIGVVKNFFESEFGDPQNGNFKKVTASAAVFAQKTGVLRTPKNMGTREVAAAVDLGLETGKAAYKVATGERSALEALEHVYDRAAAVTSEFVKHHASSLGGAIGMSLGAAIGAVFSTAGIAIGGQIGAMLGSMAGETIGNALSVGVKQLAEQAKAFVKRLWRGEKNDIPVAITHSA